MYKVTYVKDEWTRPEENYFIHKENAIKKAKDFLLESISNCDYWGNWDDFEKAVKAIEACNYYDDDIEIEEIFPQDDKPKC